MSAPPPPPPDPRPGCYDRAWNDPPLFSYQNTESNLSAAKLNKRVGFPASGPPPSTSSSAATSRPLSAAPLPTSNLPPPPKASATSAAQDSKPNYQPGQVPAADEVVAKLHDVIANNASEMGDKKTEDIKKRVGLMQTKWDSLNDHIKLGMSALAESLLESRFDQAEKMQKNLVVDWPSECGTWMVGIRVLIQETKKIYLAKNPVAVKEEKDTKCDLPVGFFIPDVAQKD